MVLSSNTGSNDVQYCAKSKGIWENETQGHLLLKKKINIKKIKKKCKTFLFFKNVISGRVKNCISIFVFFFFFLHYLKMPAAFDIVEWMEE